MWINVDKSDRQAAPTYPQLPTIRKERTALAEACAPHSNSKAFLFKARGLEPER